jgi:hypothetical protein
MWEKQLKDVREATGKGLETYEQGAKSNWKMFEKQLKESEEATERGGRRNWKRHKKQLKEKRENWKRYKKQLKNVQEVRTTEKSAKISERNERSKWKSS